MKPRARIYILDDITQTQSELGKYSSICFCAVHMYLPRRNFGVFPETQVYHGLASPVHLFASKYQRCARLEQNRTIKIYNRKKTVESFVEKNRLFLKKTNQLFYVCLNFGVYVALARIAPNSLELFHQNFFVLWFSQTFNFKAMGQCFSAG